MTVPAEIVCTIRQLDNDVQSIYEMLAEIAATQRRHGNRFNDLDTRLTELDGKLTSMDGKLDAIFGLLGSARQTDPN